MSSNARTSMITSYESSGNDKILCFALPPQVPSRETKDDVASSPTLISNAPSTARKQLQLDVAFSTSPPSSHQINQQLGYQSTEQQEQHDAPTLNVRRLLQGQHCPCRHQCSQRMVRNAECPWWHFKNGTCNVFSDEQLKGLDACVEEEQCTTSLLLLRNRPYLRHGLI